MTEPTNFRATPKQWRNVEEWAPGGSTDSCILELRARVAALEAAQQQPDHVRDATEMVPTGSLVERVAVRIADSDATPDLVSLWHDDARAAIREVVAWLRERGLTAYALGAHLIEQEVDRG